MDDKFIPATLILNVETGPRVTFSMGSGKVHIKQTFLGELGRNFGSLKPGEISFEFEDEKLHGKLSHSPSGDHIINGLNVDIDAIIREWSDITVSPD